MLHYWRDRAGNPRDARTGAFLKREHIDAGTDPLNAAARGEAWEEVERAPSRFAREHYAPPEAPRADALPPAPEPAELAAEPAPAAAVESAAPPPAAPPAVEPPASPPEPVVVDFTEPPAASPPEPAAPSGPAPHPSCFRCAADGEPCPKCGGRVYPAPSREAVLPLSLTIGAMLPRFAVRGTDSAPIPLMPEEQAALDAACYEVARRRLGAMGRWDDLIGLAMLVSMAYLPRAVAARTAPPPSSPPREERAAPAPPADEHAPFIATGLA